MFTSISSAVRSVLERAGLARGAIWAVIIVVTAVTVAGLLVDFKNTRKYGQVDLRNRVVGARAMIAGENPYTYVWKPGAPERLIDPLLAPEAGASRVTVTPAVLAVHAIFAPLSYTVQKYLWLLVQIGLVAGAVLLAVSRAEGHVAKLCTLALGAIFSWAPMWRMHIERGQAYILFSFLAVLFVWLLSRGHRGKEMFAGLVLGVLVTLRPQYALLGLPLLGFWRPGAIAGAVAGVALGFGLPMLIDGPVWNHYVASMTGYVNAGNAMGSVVVAPTGVQAPASIEGADDLTRHIFFSDFDSSVPGFLKVFGLSTSSKALLGALALISAAWIVHCRRLALRGVGLDVCVAKTLGLVLLGEMLLPIRRLMYSNVIVVAICLLAIACVGPSIFKRRWECSLILIAVIFSLDQSWMPLGGIIPPAAALALAFSLRPPVVGPSPGRVAGV